MLNATPLNEALIPLIGPRQSQKGENEPGVVNNFSLRINFIARVVFMQTFCVNPNLSVTRIRTNPK